MNLVILLNHGLGSRGLVTGLVARRNAAIALDVPSFSDWSA